MTQTTIRNLVAAIAILVIAALALQKLNRGATDTSDLLLPDFRSVANDVTQIDLEWATADSHLTLARADDDWTLVQRNNYAVDIGKIRQLIAALADATIVEEKTSNAEFYARLGVDDVQGGGRGTRIDVKGNGDASISVVIGDQAQGRFRYARISDQEKSFLIDQDPDIPELAGDWLVKEILDIAATEIQRVAITHGDGEAISIEKSSRDQTDFVVLDIPDDRELSYPTVANGIAGALASLTLEDVRPATQSSPVTTASFQTWSGETIVAALIEDDDESWIEFSVADSNPDTSESSDESATPPSEPETTIDVEKLSARLSGWQYRIADHKKNLLARRWEDLLKSTEAE